MSVQTNRLRAIEPFGQINWIADGNLLWIDLISPDLKMGQAGLAIDGRKRAVHCVRPVRDLDSTDALDIVARVEGQPFMSEINLAVGMKVHRRAGINVADVRQMAGDVARGQVERAAEGDGRVREIAADAVTPRDDF